MKSLIFILLIFICSFCSVNKRNIKQTGKIEILKVDSTKDYYVFNTNSSKEYSIVIAEKEKLIGCISFKKFILLDSIKESSRIKSGSKYDIIGFYEFFIDGIKVKNADVLTKSINNCESLSN